MIKKQDIENVKSIMQKVREFTMNTKERDKFEKLISGFDIVADRYIKEVENNARLQ